mgnify:FL=1
MGSDAAIEAADVVLMDDMPSKIAVAVRVARRTLARAAGQGPPDAVVPGQVPEVFWASGVGHAVPASHEVANLASRSRRPCRRRPRGPAGTARGASGAASRRVRAACRAWAHPSVPTVPPWRRDGLPTANMQHRTTSFAHPGGVSAACVPGASHPVRPARPGRGPRPSASLIYSASPWQGRGLSSSRRLPSVGIGSASLPDDAPALPLALVVHRLGGGDASVSMASSTGSSEKGGAPRRRVVERGGATRQGRSCDCDAMSDNAPSAPPSGMSNCLSHKPTIAWSINDMRVQAMTTSRRNARSIMLMQSQPTNSEEKAATPSRKKNTGRRAKRTRKTNTATLEMPIYPPTSLLTIPMMRATRNPAATLRQTAAHTPATTARVAQSEPEATSSQKVVEPAAWAARNEREKIHRSSSLGS